jgi:hypothetical protein
LAISVDISEAEENRDVQSRPRAVLVRRIENCKILGSSSNVTSTSALELIEALVKLVRANYRSELRERDGIERVSKCASFPSEQREKIGERAIIARINRGVISKRERDISSPWDGKKRPPAEARTVGRRIAS